MKKITALIFSSMLAMAAWAQVPVQVQTQNGNHELKDVYSITFEDGGLTSVIKSLGQESLRVPMSQLKQIHFNDTVLSELKNRIMQLENCKVMQTLLFGNHKDIPSEQFLSYLLSPSVHQVFIPTDEAFKKIPIATNLFTHYILSVEPSYPNSEFPLEISFFMYDYTADLTRRRTYITYSNASVVEFLKYVVFNQMMTALPEEQMFMTVNRIPVIKKGADFQSPFQIGHEHLGNTASASISVRETVFDGMTSYGPKRCMVTNALVSDDIPSTMQVLNEKAPLFAGLLYVPMDLLSDCGYISMDETDTQEEFARVAFLKDENPSLGQTFYKFNWNSLYSNYTIFAPNDEALRAAMQQEHLSDWDGIMDLYNNGADSEQVRTEISRLLDFVKRHIVYGDVTQVLEGSVSANMPSCSLRGLRQPYTVPVWKSGTDYMVAGGKADLGTLRYVHDNVWLVGSNFKYDITVGGGVVVVIDKAIVNE